MPTLNSIPAKSGELCRALITAGQQYIWYSVHSGQNIGSFTGDLDISANLTLSRVWSPETNEDLDFRINQSGGDSLAIWVWGATNVGGDGRVNDGDEAGFTAPFGPGHDKAIFLAIGPTGSETFFELPFTDVRTAGAGWYNLTITTAQDTLLDAIAANDLVNFVIADVTPPPPPPEPTPFNDINAEAGIFASPDYASQADDLGGDNYADAVSGATIPSGRGAVYRIRVFGGVFVHIGTAAPADDDSVRLVPANEEALGFLPAGQGVWVKQVGADNVRGSVEVWYS